MRVRDDTRRVDHEYRSSVEPERAEDAVGRAGHPAGVGRAPVDVARAQVERELSERRLIATRTLTKELDAEKALALISEQARGDLDLELTARRQEAEAEYLRKHQEAVAATQKYLDDAQVSLATAKVRANAARLEAETLEAAAKSVNKRTRDEAKEQAEQTLVNAEAEARAIIAEAENKARNEVRRLKTAIAKLNNERDAVSIYLRNLRAVVDTAEQSIAE